jgi:hypothetical protein
MAKRLTEKHMDYRDAESGEHLPEFPSMMESQLTIE